MVTLFKRLKRRWGYAKEQVYIKNVLKLATDKDGNIGDMREAYMDYYMLTGDYRALIDALELRRPGRSINPDDGPSPYINSIIFRKILIENFMNDKESTRKLLLPTYLAFEQMEITKIKEKR